MVIFGGVAVVWGKEEWQGEWQGQGEWQWLGGGAGSWKKKRFLFQYLDTCVDTSLQHHFSTWGDSLNGANCPGPTVVPPGGTTGRANWGELWSAKIVLFLIPAVQLFIE